MKQKNPKPTRNTRKTLAIISALLVALIIGGLYIGLSKVKPKTHIAVLPSPTPSASTAPSSTPQVSELPHPAEGPAGAAAATQPTPVPQAPKESTLYGTSGTSSAISPSQQDTTICTAQAGQVCQVNISNQADGETVAILPGQTIPSSGSVTWNWSPAQYQFGQGSYVITAFITVNGKKIWSSPEILYVRS